MCGAVLRPKTKEAAVSFPAMSRQPPPMSQRSPYPPPQMVQPVNGQPMQRPVQHVQPMQRPQRPMPPPQMRPMPPRPQMRPPPMSQNYRVPQKVNAWQDDEEDSNSTGTANEDLPETRAGPAGPARQPSQRRPNVPAQSYALMEDKGERTNLGNTKVVMALLSEMWIINLIVICGGTYCMTFLADFQGYVDDELWNITCWWKLAWILPLPYSFICFLGLILPFRTPKFLYDESLPKRRVDNLYILTVTKGDNREAVYRSWNAHKHLERMHPCVRVHVLTDEPYFFENINCYTCPKSFTTANSKYKARALEWYRQTMRYTEHDWILHLDEESVIDDESVSRILEFIWYEHDYHWGQGVILYNQYHYWKNWFFTVADAIRVGDDLSRFQLQYSYFHRPVFGAHGSFLLTNGAVENAVTWDLGSLTEDFQFAVHAWELGYKCGKVPGLVREQSPLDLIGFLKQRRRWYVGIRRLPQFLPKMWAFFWTLGIFALFGTIASIPLGFVFKFGTPRWFGFLKDFSFCTFVYLYLIGNFIQDLDKRVNPLLLLIRIPITFILQFIASIMEASAVVYGIILPPADFDVIKK
ncbi:glycosyl transferase family group 2-domain-containing protein [Gorgonomyces haynaldii]|nr:glycosyl transferase family group 2-domain-containing protein [Gorgonomyces haynaldii]